MDGTADLRQLAGGPRQLAQHRPAGTEQQTVVDLALDKRSQYGHVLRLIQKAQQAQDRIEQIRSQRGDLHSLGHPTAARRRRQVQQQGRQEAGIEC